MSFSTFEISEIKRDGETEYRLEFTTSESKLGIVLSENEAQAVGESLIDSVLESPSTIDGDHVDDIAGGRP